MGNVYFARCKRLIKIGYAQDVGARLGQLQTGNPEGLEIVAVLTDVRPQVERYFHAAFASARARGEWFNPTAALLGMIAHIQGGARPATPAEIGYYADVLPNTPIHENPHVDVRNSAKLLLSLGYGWSSIKTRLLERGAGYAEAVTSYERRYQHVLTGRKKSS
jgi:hypothetical protein